MKLYLMLSLLLLLTFESIRCAKYNDDEDPYQEDVVYESSGSSSDTETRKGASEHSDVVISSNKDKAARVLTEASNQKPLQALNNNVESSKVPNTKNKVIDKKQQTKPLLGGNDDPDHGKDNDDYSENQDQNEEDYNYNSYDDENKVDEDKEVEDVTIKYETKSNFVDNNKKTEDKPIYPSSRYQLLSIITKPGILAGIVGGAIIGILTAILLIMFIVYRMRKRDEGSYALEESKKPLNAYDYRNCPTKEFYA
jgi:hypothetical protein